jgi:hypothetical protein
LRARDAGLLWLALLFAAPAVAQTTAEDTNEAAYTPATLAKIFAGAARSQNDEAELAPPGAWYFTTAKFTGQTRPASGRQRPLISSWAGSRGESADTVDLYFSSDLPELQFEQEGRKYWVMAGLPGGLGFDIYPPGQSLTIYLQRIGFSSGTPIVMLRMARMPQGAGMAAARPPGTLRQARVGEGARRQEGVYRAGTAKFHYAGREYTLPLDVTGRHSVAPGLYRYENGVRTALLEFGAGDREYLLLRVPVPEGASPTTVVPYLVLGGRIVPPIDVSACEVRLAKVERGGTGGSIDCAAVTRAVLRQLTFDATP